MKIIDARTGNLQVIPFSLGEPGRGRHFEEVRISNRPGQTPAGPDDVGYFTFGEGVGKHAILTSANPKQRGILLRVNTRGAYTRGSCGSTILKGGTATLLAAGQWAEGAAGNVAQGPDQLWHVETPSVFSVILQGGEHKGWGHRYLIVTRSFRVTMLKRDDLCQVIATDSDPDVTDVVREHASELHDDVRAAIDLADKLEDVEPSAAVSVQHFVAEFATAAHAVQAFGIAIPNALIVGDDIGGVSGVVAGALAPGNKEMLVLCVGPGGGKRHSYKVHQRTGITQLAARSQNVRATSMSFLALVDAPDWCVRWTESRDGAVTAYCVANALGVHVYNVSWAEARTDAWAGRAPVPMSTDEILSLFDSPASPPEIDPLEQGVETSALTAPAAAPASMDDLRRKFGGAS